MNKKMSLVLGIISILALTFFSIVNAAPSRNKSARNQYKQEIKEFREQQEQENRAFRQG